MGLKRMNPLILNDENPSSDPIDWRYIITNKVLCLVTSLEGFQKQQQKRLQIKGNVIML